MLRRPNSILPLLSECTESLAALLCWPLLTDCFPSITATSYVKSYHRKNLDGDLTEARFFNGSLFSDSILFLPFFFQTVTSNTFIYSLNSYLKSVGGVCVCARVYLLCGCVISYFSKQASKAQHVWEK